MHGFVVFQQPIMKRIFYGKVGRNMDKTLGYLRESLSNHLENRIGQSIYKKFISNHYSGEGEFVKDLDENEISYLNGVLKREINYAKREQDHKRTYELNEVYELLF